jgi:hypothetical protein
MIILNMRFQLKSAIGLIQARQAPIFSVLHLSRHIVMQAPQNSPDAELVKAFKAAGVIDFLQYLQSGRTIMWINFKAGVAKGLGVTLGMTVVLGLLIWILTKLVALPVVGEYFSDAEQFVNEYVEKTDYKSEFVEMNRLLTEINSNLKK